MLSASISHRRTPNWMLLSSSEASGNFYEDIQSSLPCQGIRCKRVPCLVKTFCALDLVSRTRSSQHKSSVIPGKLAIASATRNPGNSRTWMPACAGMTIRRLATYLANFSARTLPAWRGKLDLQTYLLDLVGHESRGRTQIAQCATLARRLAGEADAPTVDNQPVRKISPFSGAQDARQVGLDLHRILLPG